MSCFNWAQLGFLRWQCRDLNNITKQLSSSDIDLFLCLQCANTALVVAVKWWMPAVRLCVLIIIWCWLLTMLDVPSSIHGYNRKKWSSWCHNQPSPVARSVARAQRRMNVCAFRCRVHNRPDFDTGLQVLSVSVSCSKSKLLKKWWVLTFEVTWVQPGPR